MALWEGRYSEVYIFGLAPPATRNTMTGGFFRIWFEKDFRTACNPQVSMPRGELREIWNSAIYNSSQITEQ